MKKILLFTFLAIFFASCDKNNDTLTNGVDERPLTVEPAFLSESVVTRAPISTFPTTSSIGMFITSGSIGYNYNEYSANINVKSTFSGFTWSNSPAVYLSPAPATIFAYYPYSSSVGNGLAIPVEHTTQTDYLYGTHKTGHATVNSSNPLVNLTMNHALALVQFKMNTVNYTGSGYLTKIEIANNTGKTALSSEGTMNIETGVITKTSGKNISASNDKPYWIPTTAPTNENLFPKVLVLPVSALATAGDIKINFTIDGKIYTYNLPSGTEWKSGTKNTYTVTLSGTALVVNSVDITNWTNGITGSVTVQ